jgi:tRNA threonylcarbamoyladenosine biosynthesis protein TsaB
MPSILAIDTASPEIGVALLVDGQLHCWSARVNRGSESALGEAVAQMLSKTEKLDGVVVSVGPGSFTSLRVGVATALGLAMASGCKVLPICSLKARALGHSGRVLSLLDGRKGRAYAAVFEEGKAVSEAVDWAPEKAIGLAGEGAFIAVGEGALVWADLLASTSADIPADPGASPVAQMVALFFAHEDQAVPPEAVRLRYLRAPDAVLPKDAPQKGA